MMNLNGKDFVHVNGGVFPPCFIQRPIRFCLVCFIEDISTKQQIVRLGIDGTSDWSLR